MGVLLKFKLKRIEIYPYGGCSILEYDINIPLKKEFLVLIMGPIFQIIFLLIVYFGKIDVPYYFYTYNTFILIFNFLPIYPLDGGRLFHLLLCFLISYYNSLKKIIYISYFIFINIFFYIIFFRNNLLLFFIFCLLGIQIIKESCQIDYYYYKFLVERYINKRRFTKIKKIKEMEDMKRDCYHIFVSNSLIYTEDEKLDIFFNNSKLNI